MQVPWDGSYHTHRKNGTVYAVSGDDVYLMCLDPDCKVRLASAPPTTYHISACLTRAGWALRTSASPAHTRTPRYSHPAPLHASVAAPQEMYHVDPDVGGSSGPGPGIACLEGPLQGQARRIGGEGGGSPRVQCQEGPLHLWKEFLAAPHKGHSIHFTRYQALGRRFPNDLTASPGARWTEGYGASLYTKSGRAGPARRRTWNGPPTYKSTLHGGHPDLSR